MALELERHALGRFGAFASGVVAAAVPLPFAVAAALNSDFGLPSSSTLDLDTLRPIAALVATLSLASAALDLLRGRARARRRIALGFAFTALAALPGLISAPGPALASFVGAACLIALLGRPSARTAVLQRASNRSASRTSGALVMAGLAWIPCVSLDHSSRIMGVAVLASAGIAVGFALHWLLSRSGRGVADRPAAWRLVISWLSALGACALAAQSAATGHSLLAAGYLLLAAAVPRFVVLVPAPLTRRDQSSWGAALVEHPARLLVSTFLGLGAGGALLLSLPAASTGSPVGLLDAAFTSVSATCVTGLIVVDTPHVFNGLGQFALLVLIQLGGLGIMTFSTAALALLGRRPSIRHEGAVSQLLGSESRQGLFSSVRRVLVVTFASELIGALALGFAFSRHGDAAPRALWRGLFTSVSAFCNAGFALQSDSLIPYQHDPFILNTVATLILLGGLGPLLVVAIPRVLKRKPTSAYVRLALAVTLLLVLVPTLLIAAFEWQRSLAHLGVVDKLENAFFQATTLRTAGFNSVDMGALSPATELLMEALMFIGGCPGSTAGGIKTTTAAMLVLSVVVALRGRTEVRIFGRRIAHASLYRAAAVATLAVSAIVLALMALLLTQPIALRGAIFEVFSAIGTVGLSRGATAELDAIGKVIIMACMFAGRVGPLTLFMLLSERGYTPRLKWPVEEIAVG
ncbi:MAG: potassium transporter TrkH [Deltaproteobacteria bacterium]|nr:potassium transporter TrkH [Deltaproteobacteria bacterium]